MRITDLLDKRSIELNAFPDSKQEALDIFKGQKYKTEIIRDLADDEKITIYYTGDDYVDLCR